jgi:hypothetical protein
MNTTQDITPSKIQPFFIHKDNTVEIKGVVINRETLIAIHKELKKKKLEGGVKK